MTIERSIHVNRLHIMWYSNCEVRFVNNALLPGERVTHDMVLFGYDTDRVFNHIFSIIIYFIYKEWLICSLENRQRKQQFCYNSFLNYLNIKGKMCIQNAPIQYGLMSA